MGTMIARKSLFRSKLSRDVRIEGDYEKQPAEGFIDFKKVTLRDKLTGVAIDVTTVIPSGMSVLVTTEATISPRKSTLALVKYNPILYRSGVVMGTSIIDVEDNGPVIFTFECLEDIDLSQLDYIVRIYLEGY